jgi:hypothetical protein
MMGVFSILLCVSLLMSVFTPYPRGLSSVLYGRTKGAIVSFIALIGCFILVEFVFNDIILLVFFITSIAIAFSLAEVVIREINPIRGILAIGLVLTAMASSVLFLSTVQSDKPLKDLLVIEIEKMKPILAEQKKKVQASGSSDAFEVEALLSQPKLLADEVIQQAPSYFFVGIFVMLWANLFLLLKSNRLINKMNDCKYSELYLLNFKVPDQAIWVVIGSLALVLLGDSLGPWYAVIGMTLLKTLGVFYFFQGFGIYLAFLDFVKLTGFFRTLLIVITVLTAGQILAVVGLADMFVNFKKLMKKKDQGDL